MTDENLNKDLPNADNQEGVKTEDQNDSTDEGKKISTQIPKKRFDEVNEKYKAANKRLEEFEAAKAEAEKSKLEEEGKYQELLSIKDKELNDYKSSLEVEKKNNKLEKLKNKSLNLLNKEGIIDGDDGLKFFDFDDVIDNESPDDVLSNMVQSLKESKSYLFGQTNKRKMDENFMPGGGNSSNNKKNTSQDPFSQAFSQIYQK
jgi:hypothetical protein